jgi:methionyl aminopeptidase
MYFTSDIEEVAKNRLSDCKKALSELHSYISTSDENDIVIGSQSSLYEKVKRDETLYLIKEGNLKCVRDNKIIYFAEEGDIIGYDIGSELDGWFGDAAITVGVGKINSQDEALIACAKEALYTAIHSIREGMRFKELSLVLQNTILDAGFVPLRDFCGHGIGRRPHEEPQIPNYVDGDPKSGQKIKNGMVFCLEPMICQREAKPLILTNGWDVVSADGLRGSHYEHTVAVINGKAEILSLA